jgi:hypothetical protein
MAIDDNIRSVSAEQATLDDYTCALLSSSIEALVPGTVLSHTDVDRMFELSGLNGALARLIADECDVYFQWAGRDATPAGFFDHLNKQVRANPQKYAMAVIADMPSGSA